MAAPDLLQPGTIWRLLTAVDGYSRPWGDGLATQAWAGRHLALLEPPQLAASTRALEMASAARAAVRVRVTLVLL
jgi:hypothetical protein